MKIYVLLHKDCDGDVWVHGAFTEASFAAEWIKLGIDHWYQTVELNKFSEIGETIEFE